MIEIGEGMDDDGVDAGALFRDSEGFYETEEKQPTFLSYSMHSGQEIALRLVGHNPLWGHHLWQAGKSMADYLETNADVLVEGKAVLELGAGAGLPSLISASRGAAHVVITDYPDADLIANLEYNQNINQSLISASTTFVVTGYLWGSPVDQLFHAFERSGSAKGFDLLILADLLFNHSEHRKLLWTIQATLRRTADAQALVFFTPYRPWLLERDLAFFDLARDGGFVVEKVLEKIMDSVMFEEDPGNELLRRTVFGYRLRWSNAAIQHRSETSP